MICTDVCKCVDCENADENFTNEAKVTDINLQD